MASTQQQTGRTSLRLYHHPFSINARRAAMAALQLGAPVELVFVDLQKRENHQPQFLRMNPNHKVPVLEDGDFYLWESSAIMQYLADKTPRQTIYPTDLRARADVNRWLFWCAQHFTPAVGILNWENAVKKMIGLGGPDPAEVKRGEGLVTEFAGILDAHLAGREWISGAALTLADLSIAAPLGATAHARLPVQQFRNVQQWLARVQALDSWKKTQLPQGPA
jgi:glutathione S-transferase